MIVDRDGDLVQTGPGFDYEAVKVVVHCPPSPEPARVPVPVDRFEPEMGAILAGARRTAALFGHTWVGTEHLAMALVGHSPGAMEALGMSWEQLARAAADFYDGPDAEARIAIVASRRRDDWQPVPLRDEVPTDLNWNLRDVLSRLAAQAEQDGRLPVRAVDVAAALPQPQAR